MVEYGLRDYFLAHQQLSLAEMDIEHPGSYDISSFGDRTKNQGVFVLCVCLFVWLFVCLLSALTFAITFEP